MQSTATKKKNVDQKKELATYRICFVARVVKEIVKVADAGLDSIQGVEIALVLDFLQNNKKYGKVNIQVLEKRVTLISGFVRKSSLNSHSQWAEPP
jgi:hypothetical protein